MTKWYTIMLDKHGGVCMDLPEYDNYDDMYKRLVAKWIAKGKQPADAEDIAQEAVLKSLEASREEKARAYLDRAAESIVIDQHRKMKGVELVEMEEWMEPLSEPLEEQLDRESENREMYALIRSELTPKNRAIMLMLVKGDTAEEIGWNMGMTAKAVERRIAESKTKLRQGGRA